MGNAIQKADPRLRKKLVVVIVIVAVVGIICQMVLQSYMPLITKWVLEDPKQIRLRIRIVFMSLAAVLAIPLLGFAVYLWRLGKKIISSKQFPPPNTRVVRDIPILRGSSASRRGRVIQLIAILSTILLIVLFVVFWKVSIALTEG